jgi:hypothetical protein
MAGTEPVAYIRNKYERLRWVLDERQQRLWAANEAVARGYGGGRVVAEATGLSDRTGQLGLRELQQRGPEAQPSKARGRIRRPGVDLALISIPLRSC